LHKPLLIGVATPWKFPLRKAPPETGKSGIGNLLSILRKFRVTHPRKKDGEKRNHQSDKLLPPLPPEWVGEHKWGEPILRPDFSRLP